MASQFGSIPAILAGDFQATPLSYPAVSSAVTVHGWSDPLTSVDVDGLLDRPFPYSRDGAFSGVGDGCTSIDAILLNREAFLALHKCEVLELNGRQHRPLRCVFNWSSITQVGFVHYKFAPLQCDSVSFPAKYGAPDPDTHTPIPATSGWTETWDHAFESTQDPETRWQFLVHSLIQAGAQWGEGPRKRAQPPVFRAKSICPNQLPNKCAATMRGKHLVNLQSRLDELFIRHSRGHCSDQDWFVTLRTAKKIMQGLLLLRLPLFGRLFTKSHWFTSSVPRTGLLHKLNCTQKRSNSAVSKPGNRRCRGPPKGAAVMCFIILGIDFMMSPRTWCKTTLGISSTNLTRLCSVSMKSGIPFLGSTLATMRPFKCCKLFGLTFMNTCMKPHFLTLMSAHCTRSCRKERKTQLLALTAGGHKNCSPSPSTPSDQWPGFLTGLRRLLGMTSQKC